MGMMDRISETGDGIGKWLDNHTWAQVAVEVLACAGGVMGIFLFVASKGGFAGINPNYGDIMMGTGLLFIGGAGTAFLFQRIANLSKAGRKVANKVALIGALLMPILALGVVGAVGYRTFHGGLFPAPGNPGMTNGMGYMVLPLLVPLVPFTIGAVTLPAIRRELNRDSVRFIQLPKNPLPRKRRASI